MNAQRFGLIATSVVSALDQTQCASRPTGTVYYGKSNWTIAYCPGNGGEEKSLRQPMAHSVAGGGQDGRRSAGHPTSALT